MTTQLRADLQRHSSLAFRRMRAGADLIKRFHQLPKVARENICITRIAQWLMVPFSLWPVDIIGLASYLLDLAESGGTPSDDVCEVVKLLGEPPSAKTCESVCTHEHDVKSGNYDSQIKAQHKFDVTEEMLRQNPEFRADWKWIKKRFDVQEYQGDNGVLRRRMVFERSFRPPDWDFDWKSDADKFHNIFDAFCNKWVLYGMERDKPLLQKLSVNVTPYGTMVFIPRYWSFDHNRDLKWKAITRLHHSRGVPRQGAKLSVNQKERREQAVDARAFWKQATEQGFNGERRYQWVMAKLGMHPGTDPKQLRRLLKVK